MQYVLLLVLAGFAIIEIVALWIGTRLTRTVTGRGGLTLRRYPAYQSRRLQPSHSRHFERSAGHLGKSFNSMTESLEKLIEEQKQKQRLENELVIAQEVQAQLFPARDRPAAYA